jgi:hypothetical protein
MPKIDWTPGTGRRGRPIRKMLGITQRQGLILMAGLAGVMVLLAGFAAIGGFDGSAKAATSQGSAGAASGGGAARQPGPSTPTTTIPADPAKATKLLQASTQHYADLFAQGQKIVGEKRYADQKAYGEAFANPKSAAALFAAYRTKPNPEADSTYSAAFAEAGKAFGSTAPPAVLGQWSADMVKVKTDLSAWVGTAVQYQSSAASQGDLDSAAAKVTADLAAAKADAALVGG